MSWPQPATWSVAPPPWASSTRGKPGSNRRFDHPFKSQREKEREERSVRIRYGVGMLVGIVAVHWTKKVLTSIPVVKHITAPILGLFPTIVLGPAIGAAAVYVLDKGDIEEAKQEVATKWRAVRQELDQTAQEVAQDVRRLHRRQADATRALQPVVQDLVEDLETRVVPALESGYRRAERNVAELHRQLYDNPHQGSSSTGIGGSSGRA